MEYGLKLQTSKLLNLLTNGRRIYLWIRKRDSLDINQEEQRREDTNQQNQEMDINQQHRDHRSRQLRHQVDQQCKIKTNSSRGIQISMTFLFEDR